MPSFMLPVHPVAPSVNISCMYSPMQPNHLNAESGGTCTFCGDKVALTHQEQQEQAAAAAAGDSTATPAPASGAGAAAATGPVSSSSTSASTAGDADAVAAAMAFKDRLVEYDRNSAQRTTVIDDQADFFELNTNEWLTDEVRAQARLLSPRQANALGVVQGMSLRGANVSGVGLLLSHGFTGSCKPVGCSR